MAELEAWLWRIQAMPQFWPTMFLIVSALFVALTVVTAEPVYQAVRREWKKIGKFWRRK